MIQIFKHDFLESYIPIVGMNIFLVICWVFLANTQQGHDPIIFLLQNFLLFLGSLVLVVFIFMATLRSTQQKLFGKEGYLTFSLPLGVDRILLPKIAINLFWVVLSLICVPIAFGLSYVLHAPNSKHALLLSIDDKKMFITSACLSLLFYILLYLKFLLTLTLLHTGKFKRFPKLSGLVIFIGLSLVLEIPSKILQHYLLSDSAHFVLPDGYMAFYYNFYSPFSSTTIKAIFLGTEFLKILGLYWAIRWLIVNKLELE
ncbi:hypothetical protein [Helicobacter bizzozeronii]|uniref:hypothetical protein n=1 Tax=Helicobacter bizzozeronii TaxID=56877 RepID=UPI000CEEAB8D|nr:hypothetical protein [Helicobacter bizzozeronii]